MPDDSISASTTDMTRADDRWVALTVRRVARAVAVPALVLMFGGLLAYGISSGQLLARDGASLPGPGVESLAQLTGSGSPFTGGAAMRVGLLALALTPAITVLLDPDRLSAQPAVERGSRGRHNCGDHGTQCSFGEEMRMTCFCAVGRTRWLAVAGLIAVLMLAGCRGKETAAPNTPVAPTVDLPAVESSDVITAAQGGAILLDDGARLTVPPGALSTDARVTFTAGNTAPIVPIPRTLLGRGYDFSVDGGELTGVGLLTLPLPADVTSPPYDVAPYRWSGKDWERLNGRTSAGGIQFGANRPGVYALLGHWSLADAVVALARPEMTPGQQNVPLSASGQYRYAALPALQDGYVQARLTLKQDTSGGAGRVTWR